MTAENLGSIVLTPVRPADAAARHPPAAQVDRLHRGGVDEDLEERGRLGHLGDRGGPQLERDRAAPRDVHARSDRRVDDPERVAQDPVLLEGAHGVQVRADLRAKGIHGLGVAGSRGVEPHLEQPHQLLGDERVRREGVVLVLDREGRVHAVVVLAIGAQDLHLPPIDAGRDDQAIERVGLALPAPHRADALGDAGARGPHVDRPVVGVQHTEVVQEALVAVLAEQRGRPLLDHPQTERLERRHEVRELDPAVHLVQTDVGEGLPVHGLVGQTDQEPVIVPLQLVEARDVQAGDRDVGRGLVVVGEAIRPPLEQRAGPRLAVLVDQPVE